MKRCLALLLAVAAGCSSPPSTVPTTPPTPLPAADAAGGRKAPLPPAPAEAAPAASPRASMAGLDELSTKIDAAFAGSQQQRIYIQLDKPLYTPGETIWLRVWDLKARDLVAANDGVGTLELVSPKGAAVIEKRVQLQAGQGANDLELPEDVVGGEYQVRWRAPDGVSVSRPVIVSRYEAPRIKKKLEFVRKAYGANDVVSATLELRRPTGEPLANHPITALLRLDGAELPRVSATTDAAGNALVKVPLPATIAVGDGLLTILVDDGGTTESVSKAVPIVMKRMQLSFFPEGGALVTGVESRVYFEARTALGKPADVAGDIVDDRGQVMAHFESYKEGLGRFAFIPAAGRTYTAKITKPEGIIDATMLPAANADGCVLRTFDDVDGQRGFIAAGVTCTTAQTVAVVATLRDNLIDKAAVEVAAGKMAVVELKGSAALAQAIGAARITLFNAKQEPLAERLLFTNRRARLNVDVKTLKERHAPRDQVALQVTTKGPDGKPVPAELALSVVDDTVVALADDKTGHILSKLYLEPELPGTVEEPNMFFDLADDKSALAMELLMGTRGWRRFEWQQLLNPPPPMPTGMPLGMARRGAMKDVAVEMAPMDALEDAAPPPAPAPVHAAPAAEPVPQRVQAEAMAAPPPPPPPEAPAAPAVMAPPVMRKPMKADAELREEMADKEWAGAEKKKRAVDADFDRRMMAPIAPVRVFPAPAYGGTATPAVRTDFRQTIHWTPQFKTGADGTGVVTFFLSDAVTSFRVFSEGVGAGVAGRDEFVFDSKLPFSMSVKLPLEVSSGDRIEMPLTLTNERDTALDVDVKASFGDLITLQGAVGGTKSLAKNARDANFYVLDVTGQQGTSKVSFSAAGDGLKDEFVRDLVVVPRGFPIEQAFAGTVKDKVTHSVDTGSALSGSLDGEVRFYPSPTATLLAGLDGMLREPSGCFEQTSSTNYPNVMIVTYLERNNIAAPELVERAQKLMDSGYKKLVGFETPEKGYEWFGGAPGHEALSAYGLLEFMDMKGVYGRVDDAMITRTATWLKKRRDGKGGYQRNDRALDSFGGASPDVTNAYITWALSEAHTDGIDTEIAAEATRATTTTDAYQLALATSTLFNAGKKAEAEAAAKKLASLQDASGAWLKADHSITRSGGENLHLETTALAVLALLKSSSQYPTETRNAVEWMMKNRGAYGQWGATQATVLSLKAFLAYIEATKKTQSPGTVIVQVNGKVLKSVNYEAGHKDPIVVDGLGSLLKSGSNDIKLLVDGKDALPYTIVVRSRSLQPATSKDAVVDLKVVADKASVKMGEPVRVTATITNKTTTGQPMTIARIGLPGGLVSQDWQLKKLREDGKIAFFETRAREVIVYFRALAPSASLEVPLDLIATVPGSYTAPASSAYLYYTDEHKVWVEPLKVDITH